MLSYILDGIATNSDPGPSFKEIARFDFKEIARFYWPIQFRFRDLKELSWERRDEIKFLTSISTTMRTSGPIVQKMFKQFNVHETAVIDKYWSV